MVDRLLKEHMDQMSREDLFDLNKEVIRRIKALRAGENFALSKQYAVGDKVEWDSRKRGGQTIRGTVIRVNQKTLTVLAESGTEWRVALSFIRRK